MRPGWWTSMSQRFHRHLSYSSFLLAGTAILAGISGCQFSKTLESHDPSIVPQGDVPLEASTVAAIRALPWIICGLRTGDGQLAVFAVHVALPGAEPGQPIYVVHTKSVDCSGYACSVVTQVRAMPEGPAWRNAELTARRCDSVDAATSWLAEPHHGSEGTAAPSTQRFVWRGDAWIAR